MRFAMRKSVVSAHSPILAMIVVILVKRLIAAHMHNACWPMDKRSACVSRVTRVVQIHQAVVMISTNVRRIHAKRMPSVRTQRVVISASVQVAQAVIPTVRAVPQAKLPSLAPTQIPARPVKPASQTHIPVAVCVFVVKATNAMQRVVSVRMWMSVHRVVRRRLVVSMRFVKIYPAVMNVSVHKALAAIPSLCASNANHRNVNASHRISWSATAVYWPIAQRIRNVPTVLSVFQSPVALATVLARKAIRPDPMVRVWM